ncbi:PLC-like phosphodiesterase [Gonapodya prolifera JEL478]|uniref:glycerophosphodiester phosphodiesterase n=1 Tax=Gonapodya prolifera (strain JEL478) TaxID=1344416 RepID=A0A138ZY70_GONPJ|nr:PLC-like phosphodiesterase [Gonapodya prolifera JEL478]|eukprot:KXS09452.1 PLC-like phosphodiesterase [Gonapodya prolifera JEL478]
MKGSALSVVALGIALTSVAEAWILVPSTPLNQGAYWEAVLNHVDYVEPDLVFTKDKIVMVNHDSYLDSTVDVATRSEFASRKTGKDIWAEDVFYPNRSSWWIGDFTSDEIATIVGFIPEIKQPFYQFPYPKLGGNASVYPHTAEDLVIEMLQNNSLPSAKHPVLIQSFEYETVEYLATKYPNGKAFNGLLMLIGSANWWILTYKGLDKLAALSRATNNTIYIAPWKDVLTDGMPLYVLQSLNIDIYACNNTLTFDGFSANDTVPPSDLVAELHSRGLKYSGYTSYASPQSLSFNCQSKVPSSYNLSSLSYKPVPCPKTKRAEYFMYFSQGLDNFFVENIQEAQQLREEFNFWLISQCAKDAPESLWKSMREAMKKENVPGLNFFDI